MNKLIISIIVSLSVFANIFAEIKFQPPMYVHDHSKAFIFIAQNPFGQDTIYTNYGSFDASTGDMLSTAGVFSVDWDVAGNRWSGGLGITVTDKSGKAVSYTSANGTPFGGISSIVSFADSNWMVIGSDSGVTIARTDVKGNVLSWTRVLSAVVSEVRVARGGNIWAINNGSSTKGVGSVYRLSAGVLTTYDDVLPIDGDSFFTPNHGDCDKDGNFWLSYSHANSTGGNMWRVNLAKFDGQQWTSAYSIPVQLKLDTAGFDVIRVDKNNQLWFVTSGAFDFSIGKIDLASMTLEKISYVRADTGVNPSPLTWQPLTLTITPSGEALFGGTGCFVRVDYGNSVIWHPAIAKSPATANQKNLSGEIFDIRGRKIASVNSLKSFSKSLSHGNYFFRPANINAKAEKFSVVK